MPRFFAATLVALALAGCIFEGPGPEAQIEAVEVTPKSVTGTGAFTLKVAGRPIFDVRWLEAPGELKPQGSTHGGIYPITPLTTVDTTTWRPWPKGTSPSAGPIAFTATVTAGGGAFPRSKFVTFRFDSDAAGKTTFKRTDQSDAPPPD